jgi:predicted  nucleic acid-binding Zn-ribbon protein
MAKEAKNEPKELTVEEKLKTLFQLQTMLSEIDKIKTLRGELPLEVQDLEDEVAGLSTRIDKIKSEIDELRASIAAKKIEIETAKVAVDKYKSQQDYVRNNR